MAYPTTIDDFTNPASSDPLNSPSHSDQHININNAVEALQAKVGADSSAVTTSHDYKIAQLESTRELSANKETSALDTSTTKYPCNNVVKSAVDGKIANVVEDTTPQLGGQLDVNGNALGDGTLELLKFEETASAVNEITIKNNSTGNAPEVQATGDDTNIDLKLVPKGTGGVDLGDKNLKGAGSIGFTQELDNGTKSANFSIDFSTDQKQKVTLTANTMTITLDTTNIKVGNYLLKMVNGGLATITWAAESGSILWAGGEIPTFTSSGTDLLTCYYDGTNFYLAASLGFATV
jgi:hypothetical protein